MTDETPEDHPRAWVGRWLTSEDFWKQVLVNVLSAAIVTLLGFLIAGILGIIDWLWVLNLAFSVAVVFATLWAFTPFLRWYFWKRRPSLVKQGVEGVAIARVLDVVVFVVGGIAFCAVLLLLLWVGSLLGLGVLEVDWSGFF